MRDLTHHVRPLGIHRQNFLLPLEVRIRFDVLTICPSSPKVSSALHAISVMSDRYSQMLVVSPNRWSIVQGNILHNKQRFFCFAARLFLVWTRRTYLVHHSDFVYQQFVQRLKLHCGRKHVTMSGRLHHFAVDSLHCLHVINREFVKIRMLVFT